MYTLGIVGCGIVGLSGARLRDVHRERLCAFLGLDPAVAIKVVFWDGKQEVLEELKAASAAQQLDWEVAKNMSLESFLGKVDKALVSPGINLNHLDQKLRDKTFCELDFFSTMPVPVIGITGSLGKTSITRHIHQIVSRLYDAKKVALGGNIGVGMLELVAGDTLPDWAVLELSSFQLERSHTFSPDIAVWTNLHPNHLDRHGTLEAYFAAKANLFKKLSPSATAIFGTQLFDEPYLGHTLELINSLHCNLVVAGTTMLPEMVFKQITCPQWRFWTVTQAGQLQRHFVCDGQLSELDALGVARVSTLPTSTFLENWAIIFAVVDALALCPMLLALHVQEHPEAYVLESHHHRVEFVRAYNGVDFFNDSKATVKEATLAAVRQLGHRYQRVHVIIGGVGKGVDRGDFSDLLRQERCVVSVTAFGKEAVFLGTATSVATLQDAFLTVQNIAIPGDAVLFSPGGASFDLFKNYNHRGDVFKELVHRFG